jgi:hypothetical protein
MMDAYKISDNYNFQSVEGFKMISPHYFHPTNGVRPADSKFDVSEHSCDEVR